MSKTTNRKIICIDQSSELAREQSAIAREIYPRRKNWREPRADDATWIETKNLGRYSRRCGFNHYVYVPRIKSFCIFTRKKLRAYLLKDNYVLRAGRGYEWQHDKNGVKLVRLHDNADYHIDSSDITASFTVIRHKLINNANIRKKERHEKREAAKLLENLSSVYVTLQDSRDAGNCVTGTISFAERNNLRVNARSHIPALIIKRWVKQDKRVIPVLLVAAQRTARENMRGICDV